MAQSKFLKKDCLISNTGELVKVSNIKLLIDFEQITKFKKSFGYYQIVSFELEMDDLEILDKYHGLTKIEEQFRIMKGNLDARRLFVRTEEHIHAHLCYA